MKKRASKEIRALARRAADVAAHAPLDGLAAARAVMAAAIYVSRVNAGMSREDIVDWLRRLAQELEDPREAFGAQVREAMRKQQRTGTPPEST